MFEFDYQFSLFISRKVPFELFGKSYLCSQGTLRAFNAFMQKEKEEEEDDDDSDSDISDNENVEYDEEMQYEKLMSRLPFCEYESIAL